MDVEDNECPDGVCEVNKTPHTPLAKKVCVGLGAVLGAGIMVFLTTHSLTTFSYPVLLWSFWGAIVGAFLGAGFWGAFLKDN